MTVDRAEGDGFEIPESDVVGVDSVTCRCGVLTTSNAYSTFPGVAVKAMCPSCGDWIEPLVQAKP